MYSQVPDGKADTKQSKHAIKSFPSLGNVLAKNAEGLEGKKTTFIKFSHIFGFWSKVNALYFNHEGEGGIQFGQKSIMGSLTASIPVSTEPGVILQLYYLNEMFTDEHFYH